MKSKQIISIAMLLFFMSIQTFVFADMSVRITDPTENLTVDACSAYIMTAEAENTDGEIDYVGFWVNGQRKRKDTRAPYEYNWRIMYPGQYTVVARVYDEDENYVESDPIEVTVGEWTPYNILSNGNFDCTMTPWVLNKYEGGQAEVSLVEEDYFDSPTYAHITISEQGNFDWSVQLAQNVPVDSGHVYEIMFYADAPEEKEIAILFQEHVDPWAEQFNTHVIINEYNEYGPIEYECDYNGSLQFKFVVGGNLIDFMIDDVRVIDLTALESGVDNAIEGQSVPLAEEFQLHQNFPNPFNPETSIAYCLQTGYDIQLNVYNSNGQQIRQLFSGHAAAGSHTVKWNGRNDLGDLMPSGIYVYKIESSDHQVIQTKKMMFLK